MLCRACDTIEWTMVTWGTLHMCERVSDNLKEWRDVTRFSRPQTSAGRHEFNNAMFILALGRAIYRWMASLFLY